MKKIEENELIDLVGGVMPHQDCDNWQWDAVTYLHAGDFYNAYEAILKMHAGGCEMVY